MTDGGPVENEQTVVVAVGQVPSTFDPDQFIGDHLPPASPDTFDAHNQLFDRLLTYPSVRRGTTRMQDTGWLTGELVESMEVSADYRRYVLRLREAASVWGNPLTAEDVVWSWSKAFAAREVGRWAAFMGSVPRDGFTALDRRTVVFTLDAPNRLFPHILTMDVPPIIDSVEARKHGTADDPWAKEWLRANPAGFGPFRVATRTDRELVLEARDDHWAGASSIKRVVYRRVDGDWVQALLGGEVDLVPNPTPDELDRLTGRNDTTIFSAPGNAHVALQMNGREAPFDDPNVRHALALAVPYRAVLDSVYRGAGRPWLGVVPDSHPGFLQTLSARTDLEEARALLQKSGRNRVSAVLHIDEKEPVMSQVAELISQTAAQAGFDLEVTALATRDYKARQARGDLPLSLEHDGHRCNEIGYGLPHDFGDRKHGITNWVRYDNAEVNRLIGRAENEIDRGRRLDLFAECQRLIAADVPWAFVVQPNMHLAARRGLTGFSWFTRGSNRPRYADLSWV